MAARYRVVKQIGSGGMGRVYLARDNLLERDVALKELRMPDHLSGEEKLEMRERFQLEARAAARLTHPHIVTVHDIITSGDKYFIVMEYLTGKTLGDILGEKVLTQDEVLSIAPMICDALGYAHSCGVIHRDIKPDNIFALENGNIKVTDFGIAKLHMVKGVTQTGMITGTPNYIAPEVVRDRPYDHRVDIFALGVTFYELMAGFPPFDGETDYAIIYKVASEDPPPLEDAVPDIHPQLLSIFGRMLQKEPSMRQADMEELKNEFVAVRLDVGMSVAVGEDTSKPFDKAQAMKAELESVQAIDLGETSEDSAADQAHFHADRQWRDRIAQVYLQKEEEKSRIDSNLFPDAREKPVDAPSYMSALEEARAQITGQKTPPPVRHPVTPAAPPVYRQMYESQAAVKTSPGLDLSGRSSLLLLSVVNIFFYLLAIFSVEMPWLKPAKSLGGTKYGTAFPEGVAVLVLLGLALIFNILILTGWKESRTWSRCMTVSTTLALLSVVIYLVLRPTLGIGIHTGKKAGFASPLDLTGWGAWIALATCFFANITTRMIRRSGI